MGDNQYLGLISLVIGEVEVVFRHNPRILARKRFSWKCCTCLLNLGKGQSRILCRKFTLS